MGLVLYIMSTGRKFRIALHKDFIYLDPSISIGAIGCITSLDLSGIGLLWNFPKDKFIEYEPEDERWARFLNFGFETEEYYCYCVPRVMLIYNDDYWSVYLKPIKANSISRLGNRTLFHYNENNLLSYKSQLNRFAIRYPSNKILIDKNVPKLLNLERL